MPRFSVVVPVYGQPAFLEQCLQSIRASTFSDYELLVSDDGSPEPEPNRAIVAKYGAKWIGLERRSGSAAARNRAAALATGDILVFFDSDVTCHSDTLDRLNQEFAADPTLDAVIGSYDRNPGSPGLVGKFRNLVHAYHHQHSSSEASTFWTGCGAVRRDRFLELEGFKESFNRPSIEDVEFGIRLHEAGGRIRLARDVQVTHYKNWTLASMVRTDLFARAIPWAALIREHGLPRDLNFRLQDRAAVALSVLSVLLFRIALNRGPAYWGLFGACLVAIALLQGPLLQFLATCRGVLFAAFSFPLILIHNLTCAAGLIAGLFLAEHRRDPVLVPTLLACGALTLGLQVSDGAFRAEFDGHPDEAAHFVSGLMVYDYMTTLPRTNPIRWAENYYVHYPKVAIGHWPPGYYVVQAAWWLVFPPSRASAILLNWFLMLVICGVCYRMLRGLAPPALAFCVSLLLVVTPTVQQSFSETMADTVCLLWSVLFLDAAARYLRNPSQRSLGLMVIWTVFALWTKATGVCLVPVLLLTVALSKPWKRPQFLRTMLISGVGLSAGFAWYALSAIVLHENTRNLSGVGVNAPWYGITAIPAIAGYGIFALACFGVVVAIASRRPEALVGAGLFVSIFAVSWVVRAISEPRHFIAVVPALLLVAAGGVSWAWSYSRPLALAGVPALVLFPFTFSPQKPPEFAELLKQINRPHRMMISSNNSGEGAFVAVVALTDKRPDSVAVRASKALASAGWSGENYRLLTQNPAEIEERLSGLGLETVVVDTEPGYPVPPHQVLLEQTLTRDGNWRECASVGRTLAAYCRATPISAPTEALRIDLTDKIGLFVQEGEQ